VLPVPSDATKSYRLSLYNATAASAGGAPRHSRLQKHAARLMLQATYGPTSAQLTSGTLAPSGGSPDDDDETIDGRAVTAAQAWLAEQMALPPSSLRAHYRRRVNPRLSWTKRNPFMVTQAACSAGSRWNSFAFTMDDVVRRSALPCTLIKPSHRARAAVLGTRTMPPPTVPCALTPRAAPCALASLTVPRSLSAEDRPRPSQSNPARPAPDIVSSSTASCALTYRRAASYHTSATNPRERGRGLVARRVC
jgi:hypothetical protein